jgi:[ribosomal protein S18]-alanine N-acetyltransferase
MWCCGCSDSGVDVDFERSSIDQQSLYQIQPLIPEDEIAVESAWAILELAMPGIWTQAGLLRDLQQSASHYWLLINQENTVLGFGGYWLIVDEAHLVMLIVHPQFQGQGIGAVLLAHLLTHARQVAHRMTLEVRASNQPALTLYKKFGFEILGTRPHYYGDEAALILWTPRIDTPKYLTFLQSLGVDPRLTQSD